jgi:hypothetical protein
MGIVHVGNKLETNRIVRGASFEYGDVAIRDGDSMGRLELPLPELGRGTQFLSSSADRMQEQIRSKVPEEYRASIVVRQFKRRGSTGLSIEYDDRAEPFVMVALEQRNE